MASNYDCASCPCPAGFSALSAMPDLFGLPPGYYDDIFDTGLFSDCNGYQFYVDVTYSATFGSSNTSVIKMDSSVHNRADALAPGSATITTTVVACTRYDTNPDLPCPCTSQRTFSFNITGNVTPPSLVCGATPGQQGAVTRGSTVQCTINNLPTGSTISNWKFTDGTNTATTSSSSSTWSGIAVQPGTVSVTVTISGQNMPLSAALTVNARTNFAFAAVSPAQVSPQTPVCDGSTVTLTSPPSSSSKEGYSCLEQNSTFNSQTVSGGPNSGYTYITSATNTTTYKWEIVPDLANTSSTFYLAQCGNYNKQTNPTGFISGANLVAGTQRHEAGTAASHWLEYKAAQDDTANNVGLVYEGIIAGPGANIQDKVNSSSISTKQSNITSAFSVEPFPINDDQNGNFLGNINFSPYQSCQ